MANGDKPPAAPHPLDDSESTAVVPSDTPPAKPRLSVVHLLVWTASCAAATKVVGWLNPHFNQSFRVEDAYHIVFGIYSGTVVCGLLIWIARRRQRLKFPVEPGEWLLVVQGMGVLVAAFFAMVHRVLYNEPWIHHLMSLMFAAVGVIPVIWYRGSIVWRILIVCVCATCLTPLFAIVPGGWTGLELLIYSLFGLLGFVTFYSLFALGVDLRRGTRRGWVHNIGVGTLFLFAAGHFGLMLYEVMY